MEKQSKLDWKDIFSSVVAVAIVLAFIGYLVGLQVSFLLLLVALPAYSFANWLTTVIHEVGHLIAGKLVGLKFEWMRAGPLTLSKKEGRYALKWSRGDGGGQIQMTPAAKGRFRATLYTAGGALANFAVCAGCVVIGSRIGTYGSDLLAGVVIAFGVLNAWSGFSSLKPGYAGTSPTDGLTLRRLFKPQSKALLLVEADWKERKRPRDWNRSALGQLRVVHERSPEATIGHLMVFYHCLDSDDLKMAQFALEEMVANSDRPWSHIHGFRTDILLEAASFFAGYHRDAAKAREILEKVETCEKKEFPTARRALIALDYAEGRIERAERRVERELLRLSSNDDWDEVPRDWLLKVRSWNAAATSQLRG